MWKNNVQPDDRLLCALCDGQIKICSTSIFSTAKVTTRTRHDITLYVHWNFCSILRSIALHIHRYCVPCNLGFFTQLYGIISQKNHQKAICEQNRNLLHCLTVDNSAVPFFVDEFMCLRVQCSYIVYVVRHSWTWRYSTVYVECCWQNQWLHWRRRL
jgi:hypothetical protein